METEKEKKEKEVREIILSALEHAVFAALGFFMGAVVIILSIVYYDPPALVQAQAFLQVMDSSMVLVLHNDSTTELFSIRPQAGMEHRGFAGDRIRYMFADSDITIPAHIMFTKRIWMGK